MVADMPISSALMRYPGTLLFVLLLVPMLRSADVFAVDVYRCVDAEGTVIFSEAPCGPDAEQRSYRGVEPLSGSKTPPESPKQQLQRYREEVEAVEKLIGKEPGKVATRRAKSSGLNCNGVTRLQLRNARVKKQVLICHSKEDVRSMLGEPDRVETFTSRSYDTRWSYYSSHGSRRIFFTAGKVSRINTREDKSN